MIEPPQISTCRTHAVDLAASDHFRLAKNAEIFKVPTVRPTYKHTEFGVKVSTPLSSPVLDQVQWEAAFSAYKKRADIARRGKKLEILDDLKLKFVEYENGPMLGDDVFGDHDAVRRAYLEHGAKFQDALWQLYELFYPRQNNFLVDDETLQYITGLVVPLGPHHDAPTRSDSVDSNKSMVFGNRERAASAHSTSSYTTMDAEGCAIALRILWRLSEVPSLCLRILAVGGKTESETLFVISLLRLLASLGGGAVESAVHFALNLNCFGLLHNIMTLGLTRPRAVQHFQRFVPINTFKIYAEALLSALSRPKHPSPEKQATIADAEEYEASQTALARALNVILHDPRSMYCGSSPSDSWYYECLRAVPEFLVEDRAGIKNRGMQMVIDLAKSEDNATVCRTGLFVLLLVGTTEALYERLTDEVVIDVFNAAVVVAERSMRELSRDPFISPDDDDESTMYSLSEGRWSVKYNPHEYDVDSGELPGLHLNVAVFMMWAFAKRLAALKEFPKPLDDRWITTLLNASTFAVDNNDPRVRPAVAHGASGCLAVMASSDIISSNPDMVSSLLQLTMPHLPLIVRDNSSLALAHVANRHLVNPRGRIGGGDHCWQESWIKFCQMVLMSKAADLLYGCAEMPSSGDAAKKKEEIGMRENACSALMAMCLAASSSTGMEMLKRQGLARPSYLLACTSSNSVVRSAAVMVWSLARQGDAAQEVMGRNGTVERLLTVLTRMEGDLKEHETHSDSDALLLVSTMSWVATALWVLSEHEKNGNLVASSTKGLMVLCRVAEASLSTPSTSATIRGHRASSARLSPRRKRHRNHMSALGVACLGTLRRCISTTYGQHMVHENHIGFTLTTSLLAVLSAKNPRPTAPALREAGGLLFKVQTSPYMRRLAEQIHGSSTVLEDIFGQLFDMNALTSGPNFAELISDVAIVCGSLAMRTHSNKRLVEMGALRKMFAFLDPNVDLGPFHGGGHMSTSKSTGSKLMETGSLETNESNSGSHGTMRLSILQAALNFSASPVSHREIARWGIDFIVDTSEAGSESMRPLACKVLLNLTRSGDPKVRAALYKAQLSVASAAIGRRVNETSGKERVRPSTTGSVSRRGLSSSESAKRLVEASPALQFLLEEEEANAAKPSEAYWKSKDAKLDKSDRMSLQNQLRGTVGKVWKREIEYGEEQQEPASRPMTAMFNDNTSTRSQEMTQFLPLSPVVLGSMKSPWKPPVVLQFQEDGAESGKETLVMEPAAPFNQVSFNNARGSNLLDPEHSHGVWRFPAVPGARLYQDMMHKLPSLAGGEHYYYYQQRNAIPYEPSHIGSLLPAEDPANLVALGLEVPEPKASRGLIGSSLPEPTLRGGLLPVEVPAISTLYLESTRFACSLLHPGKAITFDKHCVGEPAVIEVAFPIQEEGASQDDDEVDSKWTVRESIFKDREKECDAKDFFNNQKVWDTRFAKDWKRNITLVRFQKLITTNNKEIKDGNTTAEDEAVEVEGLLKENWNSLLALYQWFVSIEGEMSEGGLGSLSLKSSQFKNFVQMVMAGKKNLAMIQTLSRIFLSVNLEESDDDKKHEKENDLNPSSAIMAHEWMETIVRFALTLHGKEKVSSRAREAPSRRVIVPLASFLRVHLSTHHLLFR